MPYGPWPNSTILVGVVSCYALWMQLVDIVGSASDKIWLNCNGLIIISHPFITDRTRIKHKWLTKHLMPISRNVHTIDGNRAKSAPSSTVHTVHGNRATGHVSKPLTTVETFSAYANRWWQPSYGWRQYANRWWQSSYGDVCKPFEPRTRANLAVMATGLKLLIGICKHDDIRTGAARMYGRWPWCMKVVLERCMKVVFERRGIWKPMAVRSAYLATGHLPTVDDNRSTTCMCWQKSTSRNSRNIGGVNWRCKDVSSWC